MQAKAFLQLRGPSGRVPQPLVVHVLETEAEDLCRWKPKSEAVNSQSGCYNPPSTHSSLHNPSSQASSTVETSNGCRTAVAWIALYLWLSHGKPSSDVSRS